MKKVYISLLLTIGLCLGCSEDSPSPSINSEQEFLFKYEYNNQAWGRAHTGWLIDSAGMVWTYDRPREWYWPDTNSQISADLLQANQVHTTLSSLTITEDEMNKLMNYVGGALNSNLSEPVNRGADQGSTILSIYTFDLESNIYQENILHQSGDWYRTRGSRDAERLIEFLNDIQRRLN